MAWNEPGGGRDPWGGNDQKGPPDLDEALKKFQQKLSGVLGGGRKSGSKAVAAVAVQAAVFPCQSVTS